MRIDVPRAGTSHRFVKPLVVDQKTVIGFRTAAIVRDAKLRAAGCDRRARFRSVSRIGSVLGSWSVLSPVSLVRAAVVDQEMDQDQGPGSSTVPAATFASESGLGPAEPVSTFPDDSRGSDFKRRPLSVSASGRAQVDESSVGSIRKGCAAGSSW